MIVKIIRISWCNLFNFVIFPILQSGSSYINNWTLLSAASARNVATPQTVILG
jgi:hypothetical protein